MSLDYLFNVAASLSNAEILSVGLVLAWMWCLNKLRTSPMSAALLSLVGTIGHELTHAIVGFLLGAKPVDLSLFPRKEGNRWVLGSVSFERMNLLNSAPVAMAPLLLFYIGAFLGKAWMVPSLVAGGFGQWAVAGYVVATLIQAGTPSTQDFKVGGPSLAIYGLVGVALWQF